MQLISSERFQQLAPDLNRSGLEFEDLIAYLPAGDGDQSNRQYVLAKLFFHYPHLVMRYVDEIEEDVASATTAILARGQWGRISPVEVARLHHILNR
jgi:hypothetical protein